MLQGETDSIDRQINQFREEVKVELQTRNKLADQRRQYQAKLIQKIKELRDQRSQQVSQQEVQTIKHKISVKNLIIRLL